MIRVVLWLTELRSCVVGRLVGGGLGLGRRDGAYWVGGEEDEFVGEDGSPDDGCELLTR